MATFDQPLDGDIVINNDLEIDAGILADAIAKDPAFIKAVAMAIRTAQTKDARRMGNLYGSNAQRPTPPPTTKRRLS